MWTNDGEPATSANCYVHPALEVRFHTAVLPGEGTDLIYPGVTCADGVLALRSLAGKYWIAEVATLESAMGVPIDDDGNATVDLAGWTR